MKNRTTKMLAATAALGLGLVGLTACTGTDDTATTCQKFLNIDAKVADALQGMDSNPERAAGNIESALSEYSKMMHRVDGNQFHDALELHEGYYETLQDAAEQGMPLQEALLTANEQAQNPEYAEALQVISENCGLAQPGTIQ